MIAAARHLRRDSRRRDAVVAAGILLVCGAIVYLSLTALSGLPWQSHYAISVDVPSAQRLQVNDDVRIGGVRIGRVAGVTAMPPSGARPAFTRVRLSLDHAHTPLAADTLVKIRPASVLGAAYVDLRPGRDRQTIPAGGHLPLRQASNTVDITDLFDIFDRRTAQRAQAAFGGLALGMAGQGVAFNASLESLRRLLPPLTRTLTVLGAPQTRLAPMISAYDAFTRALAPVAAPLGNVIEGGAATFGALASEHEALGATLAAFPPAAASTTNALDLLRPDLEELAHFATRLRPAARQLRGAVVALNTTLRDGVGPVRGLPPFADRLTSTLNTLTRIARHRSTDGAVRKLTESLDLLKRSLEVLTPAQVYCNAVGNWLQGFGNTWGFGTGIGPAMVSFIFTHPGATGEAFQANKPSSNMGINYYPHEDAHECESGNEQHDAVTQMLTNPPGYQSTAHPVTNPPPGSIERARAAGLMDLPEAAK